MVRVYNKDQVVGEGRLNKTGYLNKATSKKTVKRIQKHTLSTSILHK